MRGIDVLPGFWRSLRAAAAVACLTAAPALAVAQSPLFPTGRDIALDAPATALAEGDLDDDGRADLALTHEERGTVSVLLSAPAGLFRAPLRLQVGAAPLSIDIGDLDGDRALDILVANGGSASVSVLRNLGGGAFEDARTTPVGIGPRVARLGDFDGDGALDAVTSNLISHDLTVLGGDGRGGLAERVRIDLGDEPHTVAVADFDGDGFVDVAVGHIRDTFRGLVSVFRSRRDGAFEDAETTPVDVNGGENLKWLVPGDIDRDGDVDLVTLSEDGALVLLRNRGAGGFAPEFFGSGTLDFPNPFLPSTPYLPYLHFRDFDGDGIEDVVWPAERRGEFGFQVERGLGGGRYAHFAELYFAAEYHQVLFFDADADGAVDALSAPDGEPRLIFWRGRPAASPAASFEMRRTLALESAPRALAVPGGAALDAISSSAVVRISSGPGGAIAGAAAAFPGRAFQDAAAVDADGDGAAELALADIAAGSILILGGAGEARPVLAEHPAGALPSRLAAADFDGDGRGDVAAIDAAAKAAIVLAGIDRAPARVRRELALGSTPTAIAAGDLDRDGRSDLLVATRTGLERILDAASDAPRIRSFATHASAHGLVIAAAGDGAVDLCIALRSQIVLVPDIGATADAAGEAFDVGQEIRGLAAADVDGDGRLDLAAAGIRHLLILRGLGGRRFAALEAYPVGQAPAAVAFADLDADGRLDALTANVASRSVSILYGLPAAAAASFRRGDANASGRVELSDPVVLLDHLFRGGGAVPCPDAADADDDGRLSLTDAVAALRYLFQGGRAPPPPGPERCGADPSDDFLGPCAPACR